MSAPAAPAGATVWPMHNAAEMARRERAAVKAEAEPREVTTGELVAWGVWLGMIAVLVWRYVRAGRTG